MCLPNLFKRCPDHHSSDPSKQSSDAIPPMPLHKNSDGEYVREKPWHSGGVKGSTILTRAVSHSSAAPRAPQGGEKSGRDWVRSMTLGYGGYWEER